MNESIDAVKSRIKDKRNSTVNFNIFAPKKNSEKSSDKKTKYVKWLVTRVLIAAVFILTSIIFTKYSSSNLLMYKKYVLNDSWSFTSVNNLYQKYLGNILPFDKIVDGNTKTVFNEQLVFMEKNTYKDGVALTVGNSYMTPVITSGIVVFVGEKENYGNTVIIQGMDGVDVWYGNVENVNLKLYDYVEKGSLVGETKDDILYMVLQKDGKYLNYDEYN